MTVTSQPVYLRRPERRSPLLEIERPLPQDITAERAVLGAVLLDNHALITAIEKLKPEDFFHDHHRRLFVQMLIMLEVALPIDLVTLCDQLRRKGELEAVGGAAYVAQLVDGVPRVSHIERYAIIVKEKSQLRGLIHATHAIQQTALDSEDDFSVIVESARASIANLEADNRKAGAVLKTWQSIQNIMTMPRLDIEYHVPGLIPAGAVTLISGLPGTHKTNLELCMSWAISEGGIFISRNCTKTCVLVLDRESPRQVIAERMRLLGVSPSERMKWWGLWHEQEPPLIGDPRLLEIAHQLKPVIWFDSFVRFTGGVDENSASEIAPVMANLRKLAAAGATPILLHHAPWNGGTKFFRGSVDILAGVDVAYSIIADDHDDKIITLAVEKTRYSERFKLRLRAPDFHTGATFVVIDSPFDSGTPTDPIETLKHHIERHPGISQGDLIRFGKSSIRLSQKQVVAKLKNHTGKDWRCQTGLNNKRGYFPIENQLLTGGEEK